MTRGRSQLLTEVKYAMAVKTFTIRWHEVSRDMATSSVVTKRTKSTRFQSTLNILPVNRNHSPAPLGHTHTRLHDLQQWPSIFMLVCNCHCATYTTNLRKTSELKSFVHTWNRFHGDPPKKWAGLKCNWYYQKLA